MITLPDTSTYDNNIATSAETLILLLVADPIVTVEDLKKLNNKRVEFERFRFSKIDMIPLIKYQIETKKATGTTLVIAADGKGFIKKMLRKFQKAFGEYRSDLDDVNERFIPGSYKFSIPINDESRIQVYAIEDRDESDRWKIVIKPVSEVLGL
ncbi:hypothetical protein GCK72_007881 [Caenorhabditis remanei]|uniref:DUF38 domain-containing protein n=1 Tax=Caenorhabditis remanei TaxID=31234 RepID=A0A6A5HLA4_CAERE|nr:hypothetical protein GCK72_007881 [Caenorhabditis remanei]KAF1767921.1 hypothetical protein GCK72_007881 [Caenorhabditis remanei]